MAGRHRKQDVGERVEFTVRMPAALKAHLSDLATAHGRSLNEEILMRLMTEGERRQGLRRELLDLEPKADDPRSDAEIVTAMEKVYDRWQVPQVEDRPTTTAVLGGQTEDQVMGDVEWMNPGGWPKR